MRTLALIYFNNLLFSPTLIKFHFSLLEQNTFLEIYIT